MFKRILVPLDGSLRAERALPVAARIARAASGSIVLLQVVNPPLDYGGGFAPSPLMAEEFADKEFIDETSYLKEVAQSQLLAGIRIITEVEFGLSVEQILGVVESQKADLIIMCSHGRTGFSRWVLGSVAQRLIHNCAVPVLVLREGGEALPAAKAEAARPSRAVVSLDGSALAEAALLPAANLVAALAAPAKGELHITKVVKTLASPIEVGASLQAVEQAQKYLEGVQARLLEQLKALNITVTYSVTRAAEISRGIITTAEQGSESARGSRCDMLAMATHGRGGLERWVMGSMTERVLDGTKLPMLVVRPVQTKAQREKRMEQTRAAQ